MNRINGKKGSLLFLLLWFSQLTHALSHQVVFNEASRLQIPICPQALNRLMVVGDRIQSIIGDEGRLSVQTDEQLGQVFIKPTLAQDHQVLHLTLITEKGLTQDLDLMPTAEEPSTILFKPQKPFASDPKSETYLGSNTPTVPSKQQQWIETLRQAVLGRLTVDPKAKPSVRTYRSWRSRYQKTVRGNDEVVEIWTLKNKTNTPQSLTEKMFYVKGDLALSLEKNELASHEETTLYILRSNHA